MGPEQIKLLALIVDVGIDRIIDIIKICKEAGVELPELEEIKKGIDEWQPKADLVTEKLKQH